MVTCCVLAMTSDLTIATITLDSSPDWIKANVQQMGFYRVNYDQANWESLTAYLKAGNWPVGFLCDVSSQGSVLTFPL